MFESFFPDMYIVLFAGTSGDPQPITNIGLTHCFKQFQSNTIITVRVEIFSDGPIGLIPIGIDPVRGDRYPVYLQ